MTPRTTLFLSTHGQPVRHHAFIVANDDHPDRPASAGSGSPATPVAVICAAGGG